MNAFEEARRSECRQARLVLESDSVPRRLALLTEHAAHHIGQAAAGRAATAAQ